MIQDEFDPQLYQRPNPLATFTAQYTLGRKWQPNLGDRHTLALLRRVTPKRVSFSRAYAGWRASGFGEEKELGEGRAFLRWLQKHELSILWQEKDFVPHPYFTNPRAPKHDPLDEMAKGLSFAVRPVVVSERCVKLYVQDEDMMSILGLPYGQEEDFLELVMQYVSQRFKWEAWRAPAPTFLSWIVSHGKRPVFLPGQLGFTLLD